MAYCHVTCVWSSKGWFLYHKLVGMFATSSAVRSYCEIDFFWVSIIFNWKLSLHSSAFVCLSICFNCVFPCVFRFWFPMLGLLEWCWLLFWSFCKQSSQLIGIVCRIQTCIASLKQDRDMLHIIVCSCAWTSVIESGFLCISSLLWFQCLLILNL